MPDPLVSVIVPAYNAASTVQETLRSVLAQTCARIEVIVVDDGSTDDTATAVANVAVQDARVRLERQAQSGVAAARGRSVPGRAESRHLARAMAAGARCSTDETHGRHPARLAARLSLGDRGRGSIDFLCGLSAKHDPIPLFPVLTSPLGHEHPAGGFGSSGLSGYLANQNRVTSYATGQRAFCLHPDFSVEGFAQTYHAACTSGT